MSNLNERFATLNIEDVLATAAEINEAIPASALLAATPTAVNIEIKIGGKKYISAYNGSGGNLAIGQPVLLQVSNTAGAELQAITSATTAFPVRTGVVYGAISATTELLWVQTEGVAEALVHDSGGDVAAADFLEVIATGTAFVKDGAARTANSGAIAVDAQTLTANTLVTVVLIGEQHIIAGS